MSWFFLRRRRSLSNPRTGSVRLRDRVAVEKPAATQTPSTSSELETGTGTLHTSNTRKSTHGPYELPPTSRQKSTERHEMQG